MPEVLSAEARKVLQDEVTTLGNEIRVLKEQKTSPDLVKEKVAKMLELKKKLGEEQKPGKFVIKCPKGTRDYGPKEMAVREAVFGTIIESFKRHGAETIDTPVFELRDVLLSKYGEEGGKLVYNLEDQGGELLSMRYDLTVPFARYLAMNKISNIKRYHIAKVYRRDQPVMTRGRYREFYQCDFDIAGEYEKMLPEAECLKIVDEVLNKLDVGNFYIKVNHRVILDAMMSVSGVPKQQFKTVCSSIDKLDKEPWEKVEKELIDEKGLTKEVTQQLRRFVLFREEATDLDDIQTLDKMMEIEALRTNADFKKGTEELKVLFNFLSLYGVTSARFEPSLARGLDYYTGVIYEAVVEPSEEVRKTIAEGAAKENQDSGEASIEGQGLPTGVGSVAAGGRYDELVKGFSGKKDSVPCCGVSFGIERLFAIREAQLKCKDVPMRTVATEVYVASAQKNLLEERMKLCRSLWDSGVRTEMAYKRNPKLLDQIQNCEAKQIPLMLIVGERELQEGVVKLRYIKTREEQDIPLATLVESIREALLKA
ncbi:unnamed protein product, partial [Mesorhabditis belari]|uniref:histidine--tRNA ligase n=1 Tax=Mesorhabditis belari TaxID=2138241 RepID=A0AAF3FIB1_9BILA